VRVRHGADRRWSADRLQVLRDLPANEARASPWSGVLLPRKRAAGWANRPATPDRRAQGHPAAALAVEDPTTAPSRRQFRAGRGGAQPKFAGCGGVLAGSSASALPDYDVGRSLRRVETRKAEAARQAREPVFRGSGVGGVMTPSSRGRHAGPTAFFQRFLQPLRPVQHTANRSPVSRNLARIPRWNWPGNRPRFTSLHCSGVATGAPDRPAAR